RLDRGEVDLVTALQPIIKPRQGEARDLGRRGRPGNRQPVAARHQRHAELAFDAIEVLVALAIKQWQQQIIVELDLAAPGGGLADDLRRRTAHAACPPSASPGSASMPARLFGSLARIMTGTISPMRPAAASAWTLCRYGLRPTSCPGCRPGFSNSTGRTCPTQLSLKARCCRCTRACSVASRSALTGSGTGSAAVAAGVPGRGEYLNEKACANPISAARSSVAWKSPSLSPG